MSTLPITSDAAALSPTTITPLNDPSSINSGDGYSLKSAAAAPKIVAPTIARPVPNATIFLITFFTSII